MRWEKWEGKLSQTLTKEKISTSTLNSFLAWSMPIANTSSVSLSSAMNEIIPSLLFPCSISLSRVSIKFSLNEEERELLLKSWSYCTAIVGCSSFVCYSCGALAAENWHETIKNDLFIGEGGSEELLQLLCCFYLLFASIVPFKIVMAQFQRELEGEKRQTQGNISLRGNKTNYLSISCLEEREMGESVGR